MTVIQIIGCIILALLYFGAIGLMINFFAPGYKDPGARSGWEAFKVLISRNK